jgi:hypothetical protein
MVVGYIVAVYGTTLAISLYRYPYRTRFQQQLAGLIGLMSLALAARSAGWETENFMFLKAADVMLFSFFVLATSWLLSQLKKRVLSAAAKQVLKCSSVFIFTTILFWLSVNGLSQILLLLWLYTLTSIYFQPTEFRFSKEIKNTIQFAVFSVLTSGLLFLGGVTIISQSQFQLAALMVFISLLVFFGWQAQFAAAARFRSSAAANLNQNIIATPLQAKSNIEDFAGV